MSGLMNSFYYGKAGKADFTEDQMPTNRVELFFDMLRIRFSGMFLVNLLFLLFCLPAVAWTGFNAVAMISVLESAPEQIGGMFSTYLLFLTPMMALSGVGACGSAYVLRNWARDQHSFVTSDFMDAVKANWKKGLSVGFLNGLSLFLAYVCYMYYGEMAQTSVVWIIPQSLVMIFCALWWMVNMLIFPMIVTYDLKLGQMLKNCLIMVVARLPWSVLFWAGSVIFPALLTYVAYPYGMMVGILLYLILGFALTGFVYASYANSCFDRFLNPRIEGAQVNQGMRDKRLDDLNDPE